MLQIVSVVDFLAAAIEMAQHGIEVNARGIDQRAGGNVERRRHGQQFAAHRADLGMDLAGVDQRLDEIGEQQHVRVQGEDPIAAGKRNSLVLGRREADVLLVVNDGAAIFKLLHDVRCAVSGIVIDDDDLLVGILLSNHRFQASPDESTTVVGHYRDGHKVVLGHENELWT